MRLRHIAVGIAGVALAIQGHAYIVKQYYQGLPDFEKNSPFTSQDKALHAELKAAIAAAQPRDHCRAPRLGDWPLESKANLCGRDAGRLRDLVHKLAPSLDSTKLTFFKADIDADGEPELLIGYYLLSRGEYHDPYFFNFIARRRGDFYEFLPDGPFLMGGLHAVTAFGSSGKQSVVFFKVYSCTECHPWLYLVGVDHVEEASGTPFQFTYDPQHTGFEPEIEYVLPGMGHSVDAETETRIPIRRDDAGPHLLQKFTLDDGKIEWWVFTCKSHKCDHERFDAKTLPKKYKSLWKVSERL